MSGKSGQLSLTDVQSGKSSYMPLINYTCLREIEKVLEINNKQLYDLPGSVESALHKQSILDQESFKQYELPSNTSEIKEKLSPALLNITPKEDPHRLQRIIDNGTNIDMHLRWIIKVRKRMHKKRRRERREERDYFLMLRRKHVKDKKREASIKAEEKVWADKAAAFDAQKMFDDRMKMVMEDGWKGDKLWQELKSMERKKTE